MNSYIKRMRNSDCELRNEAIRRNPLTIPPSPLPPPPSPRRGILLLVVLSLLTLFLLIGTAFIVSANQYRKMNKTLNQVTQTANSSIDQDTLLNEVVNQIIRDTNNQASALRFHSLLRDMYGNDGLEARIGSAQWAGGGNNGGVTDGQIFQFQIQPGSLRNAFGNAVPDTFLSSRDNAYNGLVLTFLDGPLRGQSTRPVSYVPAVYDNFGNLISPAVFRVMAVRKADGTRLVDTDFTNGDLNNSRFMINGRPFNGSGVGFDPTVTTSDTPKLTATETDTLGTSRPLALIPNYFSHVLTSNFDKFSEAELDRVLSTNPINFYLTQEQQQNLAQQLASVTDPVLRKRATLRAMSLVGAPGIGGSDESYDAPDFQNMSLALMPVNPVEQVPHNSPDLGNMVLPSFHRPALLNYWKRQLIAGGATTLETDRHMLRKVLLRPNWLDHPKFTGSNPEFANAVSSTLKLEQMIYGPWDVDNDNDGRRDSIWIDFGAPVMENSDGKLVKPLAAILILDLDGRLNLNAHGSADIAGLGQALNPETLAGGVTSDILPRGQGFGPAEISLEPIMPGNTTAVRQQWYERYFLGVLGTEQRIPAAPVDPLTQFQRRRAGKFGGTDSVPGAVGFDVAAQMSMQGVPRGPNGNVLDNAGTPVLGGYGTLPDYRGRFALGLNTMGQPTSEAYWTIPGSGMGFDTETIASDNPYEIDLSLGASRGESAQADDAPFAVAELERILRAYDPDAGSLPSRIWDLAGEFKTVAGATTPDVDQINKWRATLTTESYDLPVPNVVVPGWMLVRSRPRTDFETVMGKPPVNAAFADLLEYRLRIAQNQVWYKLSDTPVRIQFLQQEMRKLLPRDLADGRRLDINRPLGNGRDDDGNGVVDEPGEDEGAFWASSNTQLNAFTGRDGNSYGQFRDDSMFLRDLPRDFNNDGMEDAQDLVDFKLSLGIDGPIDTHQERIIVHNLRRQMLARDLFVMVMTLVDPLPVPVGGTTADPKYVKRQAEQARKLAQWAINTVDFRDPDNIMTAFEYDLNPFDGWSPDGNLASLQDIYGTDGKADSIASYTNGTQNDLGGLVWGAERPELLITETLGWHDRATENTNKEDPANDEDLDGNVNRDDQGTVPLNADQNAKLPDSDYDQRLRPKGAAFIELYCPWPENPAANADTHAFGPPPDPNDPLLDLGVNLAAVAVDSTGIRAKNSPVWRLMMYKDGGPGKNPNSPEVKGRPVLPDRSVYFTNFDPDYPAPLRMHVDDSDPERFVNDGVAFFTDLTVPTVQPGGYMVVGSGESSVNGPYVSKLSSPIGSVQYSLQGISLDPVQGVVKLQDSSAQPILDPAGFQVQASDGVANQKVGVAIINKAMNRTTNMVETRRFTFTEPALGYPDRVEGSRWDPGRGAYVPVVDIPLDDQRAIYNRGGGLAGTAGTGGVLQSRRVSELNDGEIRLTLPGFRQGGGFNNEVRAGGGVGRDIEQASRTIPGFKWVYLQRLANPLLPWNPEPFLPDGTTATPGYNQNLAVNPYMTVDSMGANVTVFTGVSPEERRVSKNNARDPILRFRNRIPIDSLSSTQRGRDNDPTNPADPESLLRLQDRLSSRSDNDILRALNPTTKAPAVAMNIWNPEAIGYIDGSLAGLWRNEAGPAADGVGGSSNNFNGIPDNTLGFLNEPFRKAGNNPNEPISPFSWFTWNNRPFANGGELLDVPAYGPSQLLGAYSMRGDTAAPSDPAEELYTKETKSTHERKLADTTSAWAKLLDMHTDGAFGHLMNFFRADNVDNNGQKLTVEKSATAGLYRVLDYIQVPSPFVGAETWLNPAAFGYDAASPVNSVVDPRYQLQPPFNRVSSFRDPGRVNLNTMVNEEVYLGLMHGTAANSVQPKGNQATHPGPTWANLVTSRRGHGALNESVLRFQNNSPTFFANPFRAADAIDLVPIASMLLDNTGTPMPRGGVQATTLRKIENPALATDEPLFAAETANDYNNADRNPYFRYQPMTRLSSMTTTRSNVYAVWVTIGFFEVEEAPSKADFLALNDPSNNMTAAEQDALYEKVYPEGFQLSEEAGSQTGDIRRVREFAIIDRTVPVAFEPGQDHNVDKAVRLRRRIE